MNRTNNINNAIYFFCKKEAKASSDSEKTHLLCNFERILFSQSSDYGMKVTPVPIPNTKVKLQCADGTAGVTLWESRLSPG